MSNNSLKLALISDSSLLFLIQCPFFLFPPKAGLSAEFLTALCTCLLYIQTILACSKNHIICIFTFPSKNVNFSGTKTLPVSIQSYLRRCSITLKKIVNHCVVHLKFMRGRWSGRSGEQSRGRGWGQTRELVAEGSAGGKPKATERGLH